MKPLKEIAATLLNRHQSVSPIVQSGVLRTVLESDGYREALNRRWITPINETGDMQINTSASVIQELRALANT